MEFIYFRNKPQLKKCTTEELNVAGDLIVRSHSIKYLGVHMDEHLNYKLHVTKKCQTAMVQLLQKYAVLGISWT